MPLYHFVWWSHWWGARGWRHFTRESSTKMWTCEPEMTQAHKLYEHVYYSGLRHPCVLFACSFDCGAAAGAHMKMILVLTWCLSCEKGDCSIINLGLLLREGNFLFKLRKAYFTAALVLKYIYTLAFPPFTFLKYSKGHTLTWYKPRHSLEEVTTRQTRQ